MPHYFGMKKLIDSRIENDKIYCPFLLAASFNGLVKFLGAHIQNGVLYWEFTPKNKAELLVTQLTTKTEPNIPAKDIFEAIEAWWKQVAEMKNGGINHGLR